MTRAGIRVSLALAGLLIVVGLPLAGKWARRDAGPRCAFDGREIEPVYRARVVESGRSRDFCCVGCASAWLGRLGREPEAVYLTDETGGGEVEAGSAHLVRSNVVTNPVTGDRTHAFARQQDAEEHARTFSGWTLTGPERPFRPWPALVTGQP
jgi:hypothetical protein